MWNDTCAKYEQLADWFDDQRSHNRELMEREYLEAVMTALPDRGRILDLGCGTGEPIAGTFIRAGHQVVGVDGSPAMIEKCRARFPDMTWLVGTIQEFECPVGFDAVIAWDSTFHLSRDDQRRMFESFGRHTKPGGMLLFTSGPDSGEITGEMEGLVFPYASLAPEEYRALLEKAGFTVLKHKIEDPDCGNHTVWLTRKKAE